MNKTATVTLEFQFNELHNPMRLHIQGVEIVPNTEGKAAYSTMVQLPNSLMLEVTGKAKNDTVLDTQGNIIKDKCIVLTKVSIDNIMPNVNYLKRWPRLMIGGRGSNQIVYSDYFGFNGTVELMFDGDNVLQWLLRTNQFRDQDWNRSEPN